jgi:hypothetical protein
MSEINKSINTGGINVPISKIKGTMWVLVYTHIINLIHLESFDIFINFEHLLTSSGYL